MRLDLVVLICGIIDSPGSHPGELWRNALKTNKAANL
jgi:hypothetical protein